MGSARLYHSCQCQLYSGTLRIVSFLPSGNTNLYSNAFPRECMCGCKATSFTFEVRKNVKLVAIRIARGNLECSVRSRERQHTLFRGRLCKNKSELSLVPCRFSVRSVMNFKDDVGTGFDQLSLARM